MINVGNRIKHGNVQISLEEVTPEMAEAYLKNNERNRRQGPRNIAALNQAMRNGLWHFTADTIKFDEFGQLIDGQHRLAAIRNTGIPQTLLVARGLAEDAMLAIDGGMARSNRARAKIAGNVPMEHSALILRLISWSGDYKGQTVAPETIIDIHKKRGNTINDILMAYRKAKTFRTGNWVPAIEYAFKAYGLDELALGWRALWTEQANLFGNTTDQMRRFRDDVYARSEGKALRFRLEDMATLTVVRSRHNLDRIWAKPFTYRLRALTAQNLLEGNSDLDDLGHIYQGKLTDLHSKRASSRKAKRKSKGTAK